MIHSHLGETNEFDVNHEISERKCPWSSSLFFCSLFKEVQTCLVLQFHLPLKLPAHSFLSINHIQLHLSLLIILSTAFPWHTHLMSCHTLQLWPMWTVFHLVCVSRGALSLQMISTNAFDKKLPLCSPCLRENTISYLCFYQVNS